MRCSNMLLRKNLDGPGTGLCTQLMYKDPK